jgi:ABC-type iron transport system FetAB permease component
MGRSFLSSDRPRRLYRTENPHPPGNSVTAAALGVAIKETEPVTSVEKGLSLIIIHYTLLYIIYYHYLLTLLCMVFTNCAACTATSHDKRLYVYISTLEIAQYCMAVFYSSLMQ